MNFKVGDKIEFLKPEEMQGNSDIKQELLSGFKGKIISKGRFYKDVFTIEIFNSKYMGKKVVFIHKSRFKKDTNIKLNDNLFIL